MAEYAPSEDRYDQPDGWFHTGGRTGLKISPIAIGMWHNFGAPGTGSLGLENESDFHENCRRMLFTAFDQGVIHFDLANVYGPPNGAAEERVGRILRDDFGSHREEVIIATKGGSTMYPGPNTKAKNRKNLLPRLDESLKRLGIEYVDIFYTHGPDPETPLEETLGALDQAVRSGKALYSGICTYGPDLTSEAMRVCERNGFIKPSFHQPAYSMLNRWVEGLLPVTAREGLGVISFGALAGGRLTEKYIDGIPEDSRAASSSRFLTAQALTPELRAALRGLNDIARERGQTLAQMAISWCLRDDRLSTVILGASRPTQITENLRAFENRHFSEDELARIDAVLGGPSS
jgi:L-glyceraldehyde 3-phosphate reductase